MEGTITYRDKKIYYRGDPTLLERPSIAVIGTRHPSERSREVEYRLTKKICELTGMPIVTGLAIGCDTIAARAAIDAGKPVIAVLSSSLTDIYPCSNRVLAEEIVRKGGCLISEYGPGSDVQKWKFIARDRLMAEIASAVIAVECREDGGTMHTVKAAHRLGRKTGCWMPADTSFGDFSGNRRMIAEYGATAIDHTDRLKEFLDTI